MSGMTLNDIYAAQIEAHFFFYLMLGACTTCVCMTMYISAKIIAEALSAQKTEVRRAPKLLESVTERKAA